MKKKNRRGWMLLESTIVVAILLAGSVAAVRLASTQQSYRAASRQSLAVDIACENAASWLRSSNVGTLSADIEKIKTSPLAEGLQFDVTPFQSDDFNGLHVSVSPTATTATAVGRNLWILKVDSNLKASEINQTTSPETGGDRANDSPSPDGEGVNDAS